MYLDLRGEVDQLCADMLANFGPKFAYTPSGPASNKFGVDAGSARGLFGVNSGQFKVQLGSTWGRVGSLWGRVVDVGVV